MFRITEDQSSGSLIQYVAKNYENNSVVSDDMDMQFTVCEGLHVQ